MRQGRGNKRANRKAVESKRSSGSVTPDITKSAPSDPPSDPKPAAFGSALWVWIALIVLNVAIYAPVWHYDFVLLDDTAYVTQNAQVQGGLTPQGVSWAFTTGEQGNWHPLTWLSHMLDVQVYGLKPGGHHLTNLLLHIANTLLLFGLLRRMTGALGRSAFVAGLFAVHPLHVESVAWVAERKDVLSTLFFMLTLIAYVAYVRQPRRGRYVLVLLLFGLGLMAKPMLVTIPFVLLLLDYWPLGRVSLGAPSVVPRLIREKVPLFALAIASSIVTFVAQRQVGAVTDLGTFPLSLRLANALVSYVAYAGKMLWPVQLAAFYPYSRSLPEWWVGGSMLGLIGVSVVVVRAARRYPYLPVGWLWYVGTLLPVIGIVQVGEQARADRYTYIPLIGLFLIVAWGIPELVGGWQYRNAALAAATGLVVVAFAITARGQLRYWNNSSALFERVLEVTPENPVTHVHVGLALAQQGRLNEAITQFDTAVRLRPTYDYAHNALGAILLNQGRTNEAIPHLSEALRLRPGYPEAHTNLGVALANQGRFSEAIIQYSEALRLRPAYADAHYRLGTALASQGQLSEAMAQYSEALRLRPAYAEVRYSMGTALMNQGKVDEGIHEFLEAVRLKPDFVEAHYNLGVALYTKGDATQALGHFKTALKLKPDDQDTQRALALLASQGERSAPRAQ
jgi:protein O-mannosyl-transferase